METKDINKRLQLFIVTFNRRNYLERTLKKILSSESPIKNCAITIFDNCSTDGTSELLAEYSRTHKNIRILKHCLNIGGNANIALALMEAKKSDKEYSWILCDDDDFDFTNFSEIYTAMEKQYDVIITTFLNNQKYLKSENAMISLPRKIFECCFLPGFIFRTKNIDSDCIQNIFFNIYQCFPHMALIISIVNKGGELFVLNHKIVIHDIPRLENSFELLRSFAPLSERLRKFDLYTAYINTFQLIKNKKLRYKTIEYLLYNETFWEQLKRFIGKNKIAKYNFSDLMHGYSFWQKIRFLFYIAIPKIKKNNGCFYLMLFNRIKICVWKKKNRGIHCKT